MIEIFQIYYHKDQEQQLVDGFTPYFNKDRSIFVETGCISNIRHHELTDDINYIGALSYKFHEKVIHRPTFQLISNHIQSNPNADIFSPRISQWWWKDTRQPRALYFPNQMDCKELAIPFLNDIADLGIIKKSSIDLWTASCEAPIYCNFWISTRDVFIDYVDNFLDKIFELINSYDDSNWIFTMDTKYPHQPPKEWRDATKFKHYPIIVFLLERLINIYVKDRNINHQAIL